MSLRIKRARALQYAAVLGEAVFPDLSASHTRAFLTVSLHDRSADKTSERNNQNVRDKGQKSRLLPGGPKVSGRSTQWPKISVRSESEC
jgi:hypothetical protein